MQNFSSISFWKFMPICVANFVHIFRNIDNSHSLIEQYTYKYNTVSLTETCLIINSCTTDHKNYCKTSLYFTLRLHL